MEIQEVNVILENKPMYLFEKLVTYYNKSKNFPDWLYEYIYEQACSQIFDKFGISSNYIRKIVFEAKEKNYLIKNGYFIISFTSDHNSISNNIKNFIWNNNKLINFIIENLNKEFDKNSKTIIEKLEEMLLYVVRDAEIEIYCDAIEKAGYDYVCNGTEIHINLNA